VTSSGPTGLVLEPPRRPLRRRYSGKPFHQPDRDVNSRRRTATGDDAPGVDHPGVPPHVGAGGGEVIEGHPIGDRRAAGHQPRGGQQHRPGAHRRQDGAGAVKVRQHLGQLAAALGADALGRAVEPSASGHHHQLGLAAQGRDHINRQAVRRVHGDGM